MYVILAIIVGVVTGIITGKNQSANFKQYSESKLAEDKNQLSNEIQIVSTSSSEERPLKDQQEIGEEHYIIRDNNGYVSIYVIDTNGKEILQEITQIVTAYLPQTDQISLQEGIKVIGKEKLNATLEDYE